MKADSQILARFSMQYGPIVGALITVLASFYIWKWKARRDASQKYHATLLKAFSGLYPLPTEWPNRDSDIDQSLRKVFSELQIAIEEYRPFIPSKLRLSYDDAWSIYRNAYGRPVDYQCYHHYIPFSDNPDPKKVFHKNVERLLSFAKYH
jgi:hypothetical protein